MTEIVGLSAHEFSVDGELLYVTFEGKYGEPIRISLPTDYLDALLVGLNRVKKEAESIRQTKRIALSFRGLQNWFVSDMPGQECVFAVLDGATGLEAAYAMQPEVAEEFGAALIDISKVVRTQRRDN